jgi:hypothetical protein
VEVGELGEAVAKAVECGHARRVRGRRLRP